jgi:hypothetical protein
VSTADGLENRLWVLAVMLAVICRPPAKLAEMDGNRTHPGRLSSAPQTVLKTAFLSSASVRQRPRKMNSRQLGSADVR